MQKASTKIHSKPVIAAPVRVVDTPASDKWKHPTGKKPKVVDIIALGPSQREYHAHQHSAYTPSMPNPDETWAINKGIRTIGSDMAFVLDDLEGERRQSAQYADDLLAYAKNKPIITSELMDCERPTWPGKIHNYPLTEVMDHIGEGLVEKQGIKNPTRRQIRDAGTHAGYYMHNSVPMILAYALFIGVREIRLYGADYTIRASDNMEENRPNCEYWVGFLRAWGVRVRVPGGTTLLNTDQNKRIYGYARVPVLGAVGD
jgi:hypothetical protein